MRMPHNTDDLFLQHLYQDFLYAESVRSALDERLADELESSEFLSENAQGFGELICKFQEVLDLHLRVKYHAQLIALTHRASEDGSDVSRVTKRLKLRIVAATKVAARLTSLLKYVYGSSAKNNPWGIVAQVDRLCRSLFPEARPIIRPGWEYNYSFYPLSQALQWIAVHAARSDSGLWRGLSNALDAEQYFFSLTYWPTAVDNILNMGVWAHEIGHFVDKVSGQQLLDGEMKARTSDSTGELYSSVLFKNFEISPKELKEILATRVSERADQETISEEELERVANEVSEPIAQTIQRWAKELFADLFSIRLFGPAALFAFARFAHPLSPEPVISPDSTHPPLPIRLKVMLEAFESWNAVNPMWIEALPPLVREAYQQETEYLKWWATEELRRVKSFSSQEVDGETFGHLLTEFTIRFVEELTQAVDKIVSLNQDCYLSANDMQVMQSAIKDLENSLPLDFSKNYPDTDCVAETNDAKLLARIINAGWLYWLSKANQRGEEKVAANRSPVKDGRLRELNNINLLLLKSIENAEACWWFKYRQPFGREVEKRDRPGLEDLPPDPTEWLAVNAGGVLRGEEIFTRIHGDVPPERKLEVRPLLDSNSQVGTCSLDVRLGNEFIVTKLPVLTRLDPTELEDDSSARQFQSKLHLPLGKPFVLHPGQFVLTSTLEYLVLPPDIMGFLVGRLSWGRLGLVIASTTKLIPNYTGCITLELTNLGSAPVLLYPCARIAQVVFFKMQG
jgi:dCTP deaminase